MRCPFLIRNMCAVYPARPIACRQFILTGAKCRSGEMLSSTRWDDVLKLDRGRWNEAFRHLLPYFGFETETEIRSALEDHFMFTVTSTMQRIDWSFLYKALVIEDKKNAFRNLAPLVGYLHAHAERGAPSAPAAFLPGMHDGRVPPLPAAQPA